MFQLSIEKGPFLLSRVECFFSQLNVFSSGSEKSPRQYVMQTQALMHDR